MLTVFEENGFKDIADGTLTETMLQAASAEKKEEFKLKQVKIKRMVGTSVPPEILQQVSDKKTGSEMWAELCNLFEGKQSEATRAYTIRRLVSELWGMKLSPGVDANLHLCKMFSIRTELKDLKYNIDDLDLVEMMLESLPYQTEFESLKSSVRYGADPSVYTPAKVRELIRAAAARQSEFRGKRSGKRSEQKHEGGKGGDHGKSGQQGMSKGKSRACFVCGSEDHLKANCPDKDRKQSGGTGAEQKRKPRSNVTIRHGSDDPSRVRSEDDSGVVAGQVTERSSDDAAGDEHEQQMDDDVVVEQQVDAEVADLSDRVAELRLDAGSSGEEPYDGAAAGNVVDADQDTPAEPQGHWWYFDTASNSHVIGDRSYYVSFTEDSTEMRSVHGITPNLASRIAGVGTVAIVTDVEGVQTVVYIDDVFYIPGAEFGLFSPGFARDQGFDFTVDPATMNFHVSIEGRTVMVATQHDATWGFQVSHPSIPGNLDLGPEDRAVCNFTVAEGVAPLALWHERLGHTCPQYPKTMVDKGLVRGMMLTKRQLDTCDACHLGKQKRNKRRKKLDRALDRPNQVVYADLLIPSKSNGTRYEAVLVIMDGYSRYVTVKLLTSKSSTVVNQHLKEYVLWAERQAGRAVEEVSFEVKQVLTDKGGEFVNIAMKDWYASQGIEYIRVGPKSSQLNLCERTHQSLVEMTKATMLQAGFPVSLWPEALRNAAYVKNRVYNKGTQGIPYEKMFGIKPDVHHIRKFGALAYCDKAKRDFVCSHHRPATWRIAAI
jgi:hypothetical protein